MGQKKFMFDCVMLFKKSTQMLHFSYRKAEMEPKLSATIGDKTYSGNGEMFSRSYKF
eukprot:JP445651.1.p1 GENE.JP445651.1~~JP445651.1.p1  ORF type:complete len:57 (-),score=18.58 JP445651.1:41-211(-)